MKPKNSRQSPDKSSSLNKSAKIPIPHSATSPQQPFSTYQKEIADTLFLLQKLNPKFLDTSATSQASPLPSITLPNRPHDAAWDSSYFVTPLIKRLVYLNPILDELENHCRQVPNIEPTPTMPYVFAKRDVIRILLVIFNSSTPGKALAITHIFGVSVAAERG